MSRLRLNCKVTLVDPRELLEFIESMPEIVEHCRSSTVATVVAIVSGEAPGSWAWILRVGKSTAGKLLMGSWRKPTNPTNRIATMTKVVMTGRSTKTEARFKGLAWQR